MARRREPRHVAAEFGRDHLGRAAGDAGDRVEPGERIGVRGGARLDLAIAHGDGAVEELDVAQEVVEEEAVVGRDAPGERLAEGGPLAAQAPLGEVRQLLRRALAGDPQEKVRLDPKDPDQSLEYFYQIRSNMAHRGKAVIQDHARVRHTLVMLRPIFKSILTAAFSDAARP